jgi:hypothetical protein
MEAYFVRDNDARGGYYDIFVDKPDVHHQRLTIQEIRKGEIPDETFQHMMDGTIQMDLDTFYDETLQPLFEAATEVIFQRGGNVNGNE